MKTLYIRDLMVLLGKFSRDCGAAWTLKESKELTPHSHGPSSSSQMPEGGKCSALTVRVLEAVMLYKKKPS